MTASPMLSSTEARRAARSAAALTVARILSSGVMFGWQLILGRWLGDAEFGVYGTIGALFTIGASLAGFGLSLIAIREAARQPARAGDVLTVALVVCTVTAGAAFAAVNGAAFALGYDDGLRALVAVAALAIFTDTLGTLAYDQLIARERMVTTAIVEVGYILVRIGLAGLALAAGFGLFGVYSITLLTSAGRAGLLWMLAGRASVHVRFPVDAVWRRRMVIDAAPLALAAFINLAYVQIDRLLSTALLTTASTGHLNAAFVIVVGVVEILSTTVLVAVYPLMARAYRADAPGGGDQFRFVVEKLAYYTFLIGLPLGLAFTTAADAITVPLFGEDFAPAADVLRVLIWYAALTMIVNVFAQAALAQNRQRGYVTIRAVGLAVKLALNVLLLPALGVAGAALASVIAEAGVLAALVTYTSGVALWRRLAGRLVRGLAAGAVAGAVMMGAGLLVHPVIAACAGGIAYLAAGWALRVLAADDLALMRGLVGRR